MNMPMDEVGTKDGWYPGLWKGLGRYLATWLFLGVATGFIGIQVAAYRNDWVSGYWRAQLHQLPISTSWGLVAGAMFTVVQNIRNKRRDRGAFWMNVITVWFVTRLLVFVGTQLFSAH